MMQIDRSRLVAFRRFVRGVSAPSRRGFPAFGTAALGIVLLASPVLAQNSGPAGFPIDWSNSHVVYTPGFSLEEVQKLESDPRYRRQKFVREENAAIAAQASYSSDASISKKKKLGPPLTVDWAVSLGTGAMAQNMNPAKYSYGGIADGSTPSCSDWVVYGLSVTPAANQATLMAVNNLYGTANGCTALPEVIFAYETAGPITTSPVISYFDQGLQVAFVDNESGKATFRVVKYSTAAGNGTAAAAPVALPGTGSQVTALTYSTTTNTNSPVYVDFGNDVAYVGDDGGKLYKISPVFGGGTPVTLATATLAGKLTGPVLDELHSVVLVGSSNGDLYSRKVADLTAAATALAVGDGTTYGGIVDPPVIVTGTTTTYAFVTTDCDPNSPNGDNASVLYEASATASALSLVASPNIGDAHGCGTNNLHAPALDDAVYNGSAGFVYVCGTVIRTTMSPGSSEKPVLYSFSFNPTSGALGSSPMSTLVVANSDPGDECSPMTYNTSGSTSRIFWGMGEAAVTGTADTVNSLPVTTAGMLTGTITQDTTPDGLGGTSGIIIDNSTPTGESNVYFTGLTAGNVTAPIGGTAGSCVQNVSVTSASTNGTTVTLNGSGFNFSAGATVIVTGFTSGSAGYNGTWKLATASSTVLTYLDSSGTGTETTGKVSWGVCAFQMTQSTLM